MRQREGVVALVRALHRPNDRMLRSLHRGLRMATDRSPKTVDIGASVEDIGTVDIVLDDNDNIVSVDGWRCE